MDEIPPRCGGHTFVEKSAPGEDNMVSLRHRNRFLRLKPIVNGLRHLKVGPPVAQRRLEPSAVISEPLATFHEEMIEAFERRN